MKTLTEKLMDVFIFKIERLIGKGLN